MINITYTVLLFGALLFSTVSIPTISIDNMVGNHATAEGKEIEFIENAWTDAAKQAKAEGKYIFVDAYAVWCGPCKLLKSTTFKDSRVADFFNAHFVNLSVDMEKGEGLKLAERWQVNAYPTLMVVDAGGKPVLTNIGFMKPEALLQFGQQALKKSKK